MKNAIFLMTITFIVFLLSLGCSANDVQKKVGESVAPGMVDVNVILTKYNKAINTMAEIKLSKINGYGPATSPIAVNSVHTVDVLLNDVKKALDSISIGSELNILLKLNHNGMNLKSQNKFELVRIINK